MVDIAQGTLRVKTGMNVRLFEPSHPDYEREMMNADQIWDADIGDWTVIERYFDANALVQSTGNNPHAMVPNMLDWAEVGLEPAVKGMLQSRIAQLLVAAGIAAEANMRSRLIGVINAEPEFPDEPDDATLLLFGKMAPVEVAAHASRLMKGNILSRLHGGAVILQTEAVEPVNLTEAEERLLRILGKQIIDVAFENGPLINDARLGLEEYGFAKTVVSATSDAHELVITNKGRDHLIILGHRHYNTDPWLTDDQLRLLMQAAGYIVTVDYSSPSLRQDLALLESVGYIVRAYDPDSDSPTSNATDAGRRKAERRGAELIGDQQTENRIKSLRARAAWRKQAGANKPLRKTKRKLHPVTAQPLPDPEDEDEGAHDLDSGGFGA